LLILRCWILFWRESFSFWLSRENVQIFWKRFFTFNFYFHFFLEGKHFVVPFGTAVTGILDMRPGKHDLHFLVGVELVPHAFVNIPDEKMQFGVYFVFVLFICFILIYIYILNYVYIYLFIVFFWLEYNYNSY
jgi:hypothetical protein